MVEKKSLESEIDSIKEAIKGCEMDIEKYENSSDWSDSYYVDEAKENIIRFEAQIDILESLKNRTVDADGYIEYPKPKKKQKKSRLM
jgi:hypothetical protein